MALPAAFLEELRMRLSLSEVVGKRLRLIRAGREFKAPCPFHNEKTPSFYVNDQKGFFHCFGCGAHGDIIGFVMRHDNLAFHEAVEQLAGLAGLTVPQADPEDRRRHERQKSLHDLLEAAARWFESQLRQSGGRAALDYLRRRGLDDATIARFRLGYAPPDSGAVRGHLTAHGFTLADLLETGLLKQPDDGREPYSFFRNRVIFPVADRRGRVVAFGARLMQGDGPKYVNSPESPLFQKGRLLYGMALARLAAADGQPLILAEGYMDVISLHAAGFTGAVAPLGTALTESQVLELWKLAPPGQRVPILCFDGDEAGRRAAFRAVERILPLLQPDHSVRIAFMPEGEDPDSLVHSGGTRAMQAVLDGARPLADLVWDMEARNRQLDTPEARAGLQAALRDRVATIAEGSVQRFFREEMDRRISEAFDWRAQRRQAAAGADRYGADRSGRPAGDRGWKGGAGRQQRFGRSGPPPVLVERRTPRAAQTIRERVLLATMISHPQLFDEFGELLASCPFSDVPLDRLRQAVIDLLSSNSALDAEALWRHLSETGLSDILDGLLSAATFVHASFARPEAAVEAARAGWREVWGHMLRGQVQHELAQAGQTWARDGDAATLSRLKAVRREAETGLDDQDETEGTS